RFFEWQASIPDKTSIELSVQSKASASAAYAPTAPLLYATGTESSIANEWLRGARSVDQGLASAGPTSQSYLLVTLALHPDSAGQAAPTLFAWRQIYDCVPQQ